MHIRKATPKDNDELKALQAQCPMGTSLIFTTANTPDFFARAKAYPSYQVYAACQHERIIASAACAIRDATINGRACRVGYEFQYFSSPHHRKKGAARELHQHIQTHLAQNDVALSYLITTADNVPAIKLFTGQGFYHHRTLVIPNLLVYKHMDVPAGGKIRPATPQDLAPVAALLNETWQGHNLYAPTSAEALDRFIQRVPAYNLDDLLILQERGEIVACLGFWDWSKITHITVQTLDLKLRILRRLLDLARIFRPMPRVVPPGSSLKQWAVTPMAFKTPAHLATLLRYANNQALERGIEQIVCIGEQGHRLFQGAKGFFRADVTAHLYVQALQPDIVLGDAPIFMDGIDL